MSNLTKPPQDYFNASDTEGISLFCDKWSCIRVDLLFTELFKYAAIGGIESQSTKLSIDETAALLDDLLEIIRRFHELNKHFQLLQIHPKGIRHA
jgi:hypothetical protein